MRRACAARAFTATEGPSHTSVGVRADAPMTHAGTLLVDGAVSSSYANFYSHSMAQLAFAPLRWMDAVSPGVFDRAGAKSAHVHPVIRPFMALAAFVPDSWFQGM